MKSYQKSKRGYLNRRVCPISGDAKARRHVVSRGVWEKLTGEQKKALRANANDGSLRQYKYFGKRKGGE